MKKPQAVQSCTDALPTKPLPLYQIEWIHRYKWSVHIETGAKLRITAVTKRNYIPLVTSIYELNMRTIGRRITATRTMARTRLKTRTFFPVIQPR